MLLLYQGLFLYLFEEFIIYIYDNLFCFTCVGDA